jgi:hypothetical protein
MTWWEGVIVVCLGYPVFLLSHWTGWNIARWIDKRFFDG